ncbi:MAG: UDP-N-acetylmuramoyl-L-alanyl-D-glutamate--2,6-diaminopimelate ligase [Oscillochloris sp.]|nr:UDP-N-acetylmuramoyl-L-alanyl-D-glutamate--2,6-diaminopimelate ligase [Oscillochloris sp.]
MKSLRDLLADVPVIDSHGSLDLPIAGLAYDSRRVVPGGLFVAISGFHVDGHSYVGQAIERGATAVLVAADSWQREAPAGVTLVRVADSRTLLAPLAAAWYGYPGRHMPTIGITGTKGKSTTTDLTAQLLDACGRRSGMISTVEFKIGPQREPNKTRQSTPEAPEVQALLSDMLAAGCDIAVIEATSHALSAGWNRLGGCAFDVAVLLNITHEHLDYHGSFAQYRADKARLFEMLGEAATPGERWAIVSADDPNRHYFFDAAPAAARRLSFGFAADADVRAEDVQLTPMGAHCRIVTPWGAREATLALPGRFNLGNSLAAVSIALTQGATLDTAITALAQVRAPRGRMQPVRCGQPFDVIVDYAHNPDSFEQVMSMLRPLTQGRMIAVFGSAGERDRAKRPLQGAIAARYCELLVLTDEDPRGEDRAAIIAEIAAGAAQAGYHEGRDYLRIPDRAAAIRAAIDAAQPGDLILLLGKGHEGNIIYADHILPWDEAAAAVAALYERGYRE